MQAHAKLSAAQTNEIAGWCSQASLGLRSVAFGPCRPDEMVRAAVHHHHPPSRFGHGVLSWTNRFWFTPRPSNDISLDSFGYMHIHMHGMIVGGAPAVTTGAVAARDGCMHWTPDRAGTFKLSRITEPHAW